MRNRLLPSLLGAVMLSGCSLVPDYLRPGLPVSEAWPDGPAYRSPPAPVASPANPVVAAEAIGWRDFFTDPQLQALIEIALRNNRDLRVATLNVAGAEAQYRVQRSDLFPRLGLSGAGTVTGLPENNSGAGAGLAALSNKRGGTTRLYNLNAGFTAYELDLFGRVRSLSEQAFEQYLGYAETRRSSQITLVAQVANAYLAVLSDRALLQITRDTLDSQTKSYDITRMAFTGGTTTELALKQALTAVETARVNLAQYTRQDAQDTNALVLLLGQPMPADLPRPRGIDDQQLMAELPAGLPSDLLTNRPDVMAAEHNLQAANANIGAARAAFFPSISLTASGGLQSGNLGTLFTGGATTWSFAPQITIPIFTAGQNQGNLDLAKIQKNISIAQYEKTIQIAFREVSDGLAARGTYLDQISAQQSLVGAYADAYRLSDLRFRAGVDTFLPLLDSQRQLYAAQQNLITLKQAQLANLITLYKALGGGWTERQAVAG